MTDDRIVKDTARDPEREALGSTRGGVRAAAGKVAKKTTKKVTRKAVRKETAKKTAAAGRTTKKKVAAAGKTAKAAAKKDKPAPPGTDTSAPEAVAPSSRTTKVSAAGSRVASARAPAASSPAGKGATARKSAAARVASAAENPSDAAAPEGGSAANAPAVPAAPLPGPGTSAEAPRPPAPLRPGAYADSTQEQSGGLGSLLALWGPLIIVGFLVLVFRGGAERASAVAAGPDAQARSAAVDAPAQVAGGPEGRDAIGPSAGAQTPERAPGARGAGRVVAEAFDRGFAMRTSMAGGPPFAGREPGAPMPAGSPGRLYPAPPGPYRDPRYGLPADEHWTAGGAGDWTSWSAGGRAGSGQEDGGGARVEWVRCAPPYHWCPAPGNPAW